MDIVHIDAFVGQPDRWAPSGKRFELSGVVFGVWVVVKNRFVC